MGIKKTILLSLSVIIFVALIFCLFTIFFDQAVLVRRHTFFRGRVSEKVVALTFDDGPSDIWTPKILDALKAAKVSATFFVLGTHVVKYPEITRRIVQEGHEIGNHTYDHHVLIYYKIEELEKQINVCAQAVKDITGIQMRYFRPPKAWINEEEKKVISRMGYKTVLWSLNSKDWVTFDDKYIINFIARNIRPGDIILFHDSGGVFSVEGGDRSETVEAIPKLIKRLKTLGYSFLTISEMLELEKNEKGFHGKN